MIESIHVGHYYIRHQPRQQELHIEVNFYINYNNQTQMMHIKCTHILVHNNLSQLFQMLHRLFGLLLGPLLRHHRPFQVPPLPYYALVCFHRVVKPDLCQPFSWVCQQPSFFDDDILLVLVVEARMKSLFLAETKKYPHWRLENRPTPSKSIWVTKYPLKNSNNS